MVCISECVCIKCFQCGDILFVLLPTCLVLDSKDVTFNVNPALKNKRVACGNINQFSLAPTTSKKQKVQAEYGLMSPIVPSLQVPSSSRLNLQSPVLRHVILKERYVAVTEDDECVYIKLVSKEREAVDMKETEVDVQTAQAHYESREYNTTIRVDDNIVPSEELPDAHIPNSLDTFTQINLPNRSTTVPTSTYAVGERVLGYYENGIVPYGAIVVAIHIKSTNAKTQYLYDLAYDDGCTGTCVTESNMAPYIKGMVIEERVMLTLENGDRVPAVILSRDVDAEKFDVVQELPLRRHSDIPLSRLSYMFPDDLIRFPLSESYAVGDRLLLLQIDPIVKYIPVEIVEIQRSRKMLVLKTSDDGADVRIPLNSKWLRPYSVGIVDNVTRMVYDDTRLATVIKQDSASETYSIRLDSGDIIHSVSIAELRYLPGMRDVDAPATIWKKGDRVMSRFPHRPRDQYWAATIVDIQESSSGVVYHFLCKYHYVQACHIHY